MPLTDLTVPAIYAAIAEFQRVGRDAFLKTHRYGPAVSYFVQEGDKFYDSKAIAGVAHGYARPDLGPLPANEFSGGEATVQRRLEELGFTVVNQSQRNPSWVRDELILALDFYLTHRTTIPDKASTDIAALSRDISALGQRLNVGGSETFRNANGVYMKLMTSGVLIRLTRQLAAWVYQEAARQMKMFGMSLRMIRSAFTPPQMQSGKH